MIYRNCVKSVLDRLFGLFGLLLFSPVLLLISIVLIVDFKGTPFFTQARVGKNERIFRIYKFKTMRNLPERSSKLVKDKDRLTPIGRWLRKTSLDELPQLWNLLLGEMSLIGPRPLLVEYLPLYSQEEVLRHLVKPGITGLAQINGRNALSWKEKFAYDIYYVKHQSLSLDVAIFLKSIVKPFDTKGIYNIGEEVEPFKGHKL